MIQDVERFQPELELVMLAVGHREFLVRVKIQPKDAGPDQRVPSHIAPGSGWRLDNSRRVVPAGGRRTAQEAAPGAGWVGGILTDPRIGGIRGPNGDHLRGPALDRSDSANLPASHDRVPERV